MGINIIIDNQLYHFDEKEYCTDLLDRYADDVMEVSETNNVLTDEEWDTK